MAIHLITEWWRLLSHVIIATIGTVSSCQIACNFFFTLLLPLTYISF